MAADFITSQSCLQAKNLVTAMKLVMMNFNKLSVVYMYIYDILQRKMAANEEQLLSLKVLLGSF